MCDNFKNATWLLLYHARGSHRLLTQHSFCSTVLESVIMLHNVNDITELHAENHASNREYTHRIVDTLIVCHWQYTQHIIMFIYIFI